MFLAILVLWPKIYNGLVYTHSKMHQKLLEDNISSMEEINDSLEDAKKTFNVFGSFNDSTLKSL